MTPWIAFNLLFALGLAMVLRGRGVRNRRGLSQGRTLDLDGQNLYFASLGLSGRPDRILEEGGAPIPEEWKSAMRLYESHVVQLGTYFLLIEDEAGIRPPHGYVVLGNGQRHRIENSDELRTLVLTIADQIRAARKKPQKPITVNQPAVKCQGCGMKKVCGQTSHSDRGR